MLFGSRVLLLLFACLVLSPAATTDDPFASPARVHVFLFVRTDCPLTNRYAPELQRISQEFAGRSVDFWLVYPAKDESDRSIAQQIADYHLPGKVLRDVDHRFAKRAQATIAPEAAVFDSAGQLKYHGRIDDRWVAFGKARPAPRTHDLEEAISSVLAGKPVAQAETHAIGCSLADVE
jgi:hypothetical protein